MTTEQREVLTEFFQRIYTEISNFYKNLTKQELLDFLVKTYFQMYKGDED